MHLWSRAQEAKRHGAKLIAIDPYRSLTAEKCHQHIALLPGTDGALALGVMHVLVREGWLDRDYIERYTLGFDALAARAGEFDPQRVARLCGITAGEVEQLARDYWEIRPAAIRLNYGMQRAAGGGNAVRAIACLPALAGHWRDPAGGVLLSTSGNYPVDAARLYRPELLAGRTPRTINMSTIGHDLLHADPPIDALIVYNSNPVAVAPQSREVAAGFGRDDLFTVVLEQFQTDTADYADFVLPATTQLEHVDVHKSYGHLYLLANNPAIDPLGEALPNSEIFRRLASKMGFTEPALRETDDELAAQAFARGARPRDYDWPRLKQAGWERLDLPVDPRAVRAWRSFRHRPASANSVPTRLQQSDSIRCRATCLPTKGRPAIRAAPHISARHHFAAGAQFSELHFRQCDEPSLDRGRSDARDPSGRRTSPQHPVRRLRSSVQRPWLAAVAGSSDGPRATRLRRGAVGLVEEVRSRRQERQRTHQPGADGHRARSYVLRLPGRGRAHFVS